MDQITKTKGVIQSATTLLGTIGVKIQAGIDAALANGATAAELAPVQQAVDDLATDTAALATAVAANP